MASDQRYCLQCGERAAPVSGLLLGIATNSATAASPAPAPGVPGSSVASAPGGPSQPPAFASGSAGGAAQRGNTLLVIAGVGVLMLAMGVGVLIGRSGQPKQAPASAPEVITVAAAGSGASTAPSEAPFSADWPAGVNGYTVQLQSLPEAGTTVSAVQAAKTAASAKGAKDVGALKSEQFTSLTAGSYLIYSGVDHNKGEAEKALKTLSKSFPAAKVIAVSNRGSTSTGNAGASSGSGVGSSESHPAPASVLEGESKAKGKNYEEKSKNLPDVVETG